MSREAVASAFLVSGFSFSGMGENAALAFPTFKDWSVRGAEQSAAPKSQPSTRVRGPWRRHDHGGEPRRSTAWATPVASPCA
jgi:hypothetical protein